MRVFSNEGLIKSLGGLARMNTMIQKTNRNENFLKNNESFYKCVYWELDKYFKRSQEKKERNEYRAKY